MYFMWPVEIIIVLSASTIYLGYTIGTRIGIIKLKNKKMNCGCGKCGCGGN